MRRASLRSCRTVVLSVVMLATLLSSAPAAEDEGKRGRGRPYEEKLAAPAISSTPSHAVRPPVKLERFAIPATDGDKGSIATDAAVMLPLPPTSSEHAKLAAARAAVERARGAGTLYRARRVPIADPALRERLLADKAAKLRAGRTSPLPPDDAAGVGSELPSVQKQGPAGLTEAEQLKVERSAKDAGAATSRDAQPKKGGR